MCIHFCSTLHLIVVPYLRHAQERAELDAFKQRQTKISMQASLPSNMSQNAFVSQQYALIHVNER